MKAAYAAYIKLRAEWDAERQESPRTIDQFKKVLRPDYLPKLDLAEAYALYTEHFGVTKAEAEPPCAACGGPCVYRYTAERAKSAEALGNDQEFYQGYLAHQQRLTAVAK